MILIGVLAASAWYGMAEARSIVRAESGALQLCHTAARRAARSAAYGQARLASGNGRVN